MSKQYGTIPRSTGQKKAAPPAQQQSPSEILIAIHGRHTLEQLAQELQVAIARLQDLGVYGVEKFRIRFETRDQKGEPRITRNRAGEPVRVIQIPEPEQPPAYRPGPYDQPPMRSQPKSALVQQGQPAGHPAPIRD